MSTALSHIRYLISDFTAVLHFYRDVLGLKLAVDVPDVYAEFETPGARLSFYRADLMADVVGALSTNCDSLNQWWSCTSP